MRGVKAGDRLRSPVERILARVVITETGCWEFTGSRQKRGHGLIRVGSRTDGTTRVEKAHRVMYEALVGPIVNDLDHAVCQNPPCVNPDHLEDVTRGENNRREADRRTHCRHGHPWIPENITTFGDGRRTCSTCWAATRERNR